MSVLFGVDLVSIDYRPLRQTARLRGRSYAGVRCHTLTDGRASPRPSYAIIPASSREGRFDFRTRFQLCVV